MRQAFKDLSAKVARLTVLFALSVIVLGPVGGVTFAAAESQGVTIEGAFARATIGQGRVGAVYFMIHNGAGVKDRLTGASAEVAKRVELHTHLHENGVMKMRPIEGVDVPARGMVALKPGGDHVMLMGLSAPLKEGDHFPLVLTFEKAGEISVMVSVGGVGASGSAHTGHRKKHKHGD
jgi:copper(I)-binding protein